MGGGAQSPSLSDPDSCPTVRVSGEARWVWRLEHGDTGASWVGPAVWGRLPGGRNRDTEGRNGVVRVSGQVSLSGEKRPEWGPGGPRAERRGGWGWPLGRGRGVRPGAGRGLTCSKAQLSATRLALRSSSGSGRPRRAPVPGSSPAGQPRLRLAAGGSIRPGRPGDAAPLRLFTTMKPSPQPLPPQPKPRPRRPASPSPLVVSADPPPKSRCSFGIHHVRLSGVIQ